MSEVSAIPEVSTASSNGGLALPGSLRWHGARAITLRTCWRLAAVVFIGVSLSMIPALILLSKAPAAWVYVTGAAGIAAGLICLRLPWQRIDERWLNIVPPLLTLEIALAVAATDYALTYLYFFAALFVGLVFPSPREMLPFLALIAAALFLPFAYASNSAQNTALWLVAVGPPVMLTAILVGRLTSNLETSRETYRKLSGVDGLTGVGNYRALIERLGHETARHRRRGRQFALLCLDLDRFKGVNETQGHLIGDIVLAIVGSLIDLEVRAEDAVFRQGGDEFSVIAPETEREEAILLASRIRRALERVTSGPVRLSASIGIAVFPEDGNDPGELLDFADAAARAQKSELATSTSWGRF